ncbi:UNVERIFIED_CONTAM: hypothetical protein NCL1_05611 [Trichonephila clavipes]
MTRCERATPNPRTIDNDGFNDSKVPQNLKFLKLELENKILFITEETNRFPSKTVPARPVHLNATE